MPSDGNIDKCPFCGKPSHLTSPEELEDEPGYEEVIAHLTVDGALFTGFVCGAGPFAAGIYHNDGINHRTGFATKEEATLSVVALFEQFRRQPAPWDSP